MMIPSTVERVPLHTAEEHNERIRRHTQEKVASVAAAGMGAIERRLRELDEEWDIERTLEANAASVVLIGSALGLLVDRRFFALPAVVAGFLLQHAVQGWCPPVPFFRRRGFRTEREINEEREALKALRGDYQQVSGDHAPARVSEAIAAARR